MATNFQILDLANSCFLVSGDNELVSRPTISSARSFASDDSSDEVDTQVIQSPDPFTFSLFVGKNVTRFVTPEFTVPGSKLVIRLKIMRETNSSDRHQAIQFLLTTDDVIEVKVNGKPAILTSGSDSFVYKTSDSLMRHGGHYYASHVYRFEFSGIPLFPTVESTDEKDVTLVADGKKILISKRLLVSKSDVFKAMFEHDSLEKQTGVVKMTSFSFRVVEQMVHFMTHGHCSLWYTELDRLTAIADCYNIKDMIEVAAEKKKLMDRI